MKTSDAGVNLIAKWEGFRSQPYNDAANHATIGYGHLLHHGPVTAADKRRFSGGITRTQGLAMLRGDIARFEQAVNRLVKVPLTQGQFDALVSFSFNVGEGALRDSTLLRKLNDHNYAGARAEFGKWVKAGGRTLQGLVNRRREEAALFGRKLSNKDRKKAAWQERLDKIRRVADKRRKQGQRPAWTRGMRARARIYKRLLRRHK